MFKSFSCDWLKLARIQVLRSGWSIVILVGLSLFICSFTGRQAFMVWWLALSGVVLIGFSIFLGNLPYRLLKPEMHISRHARFPPHCPEVNNVTGQHHEPEQYGTAGALLSAS
ncbi:TPA: hypothetical protein ACP2JX_001471 [Escherichia coli]